MPFPHSSAPVNEETARPGLAVIVPCYNEGPTVGRLLQQVLFQPLVTQVIAVDDGSTDDTAVRLAAWAARDPRVLVLRHPCNRGKGAAIQTALPHVRAQFVLIQDADLEYDPSDYERLLEPLLSGEADVVYGTRFGPGAEAHTAGWHRCANRLLTFFTNRITGLHLTDEATCYKLFPTALLRELDLRQKRFGFCPEVTAKLACRGARIVEVPIRYHSRTRSQGKKIRCRDGIAALWCLAKYSRSRARASRPEKISTSSKPCPGASAALRRTVPALAAALWGLLYATAFALGTGLIPQWGRWFSISPYYRMQVAAFLRGDLAISRNPADLAHDLCWSEGGVHQVWGLGVPLWRLPFECVALLLGEAAFPDMAAVLAAMAIAAAFYLHACLGLLVPMAASPIATRSGGPACRGQTPVFSEPDRARGRWQRMLPIPAMAGAALLLLLFPPLFRLLRTSFRVYEEAITYEYILGLCLIAALIRLASQPTTRRFLVLGFLAGFGMWIRPTLVFHGAAALVAGAWTLFYAGETGGLTPVPSGHSAGTRWRRFARQVAPGTILYVCLGLGLYCTNLLRFGNGFEFGHRLNIQPSTHGSVYSTRFDHPFRKEPFWRAARELFGFLFLPKRPNPVFWSDPTAVMGISPTPRWREVFSLTYDPTYLLWVASGWISAGYILRRAMRRTRGADVDLPGSAEADPVLPTHGAKAGRALTLTIGALGLQSFLATLALFGFYLHNCVISTRYMFDFMPSFAGGMLAAWLAWLRFCSNRPRPLRWMVLSLVGMTAWLSWQMGQRLGCEQEPLMLSWDRAAQRARQENRPAVQIPADGSYEGPEEAAQAGMLQDGCGWDPNTRHLMASAYFFVRDPEFIELDLAMDPNIPLPADPGHVRAKIGLEWLRLERTERTADGWRLRFAGPTQSRYRRGIQPLFVATVPPEQVAEANPSPWRLLQLRWRAGPHQPQQQDEHPQTR